MLINKLLQLLWFITPMFRAWTRTIKESPLFRLLDAMIKAALASANLYPLFSRSVFSLQPS